MRKRDDLIYTMTRERWRVDLNEESNIKRMKKKGESERWINFAMQRDTQSVYSV